MTSAIALIDGEFMGKQKFTQDQIQNAVSLVRGGMTKTRAASITGLSKSYVQRLCSEAGLQKKHHEPTKEKEIRQQMRELWDDPPPPKKKPPIPDSPCIRCPLRGLCITSCILQKGIQPK